jgi:hypothetical protein
MDRRLFVTSALTLPLAGAAWADPVKLRELYEKSGGFSEWATAREGERIEVEGFMAPPLKADSKFFVLTKMPMATCPFCETEADWPDDILAVYTKRVLRVTPPNVKITVSGVLHLDQKRDQDTGFLSLIRLEDATYG